MRHRRPLQGAAALQHVGEIHQRPVAQAQGKVQIAQADVHVDAQDPVPQGGQTGGDSAGEGGLSRTALAGGDHDRSGHSVPPVRSNL